MLRRVPHGYNSTGGDAFAAAERAFAARWHVVNTTVPAGLPLPSRRKLLDAQWRVLLRGSKEAQAAERASHAASENATAADGEDGLAGSVLAIEPLYFGACADDHACVGVRVADGACVCS